MLLTLLPLFHPLPSLNSSSVWTPVSPRKYKKTVSFENLWVLQMQFRPAALGWCENLLDMQIWGTPRQTYWTQNSGLGPSLCVLLNLYMTNVTKSLKTTDVGPQKWRGGRMLKLVYNPLKMYPPGFPWWSSGWESTCANAGGKGFDCWSGNIPHAEEHLSWCPVTAEAWVPRVCTPQQ